jgi:hypothetical protein
MKLKSVIKPITLQCAVLLIAIAQGCHWQDGLHGVSDDVAESKKRGVFVCEYAAPTNPVVINDFENHPSGWFSPLGLSGPGGSQRKGRGERGAGYMVK